MQNLRINAERMWQTIQETASIGATANGGLRRLALSDEDRRVRDWLVSQCQKAGCEIGIDELGTIFAQRAGRSAKRLPIAFGSHLDTQPAGGRFDGVLGVLAGLELIRTLNDAGVETAAPICLINWTNEEGSQFAPATLASGAYAAEFDIDWARGRRGADGITFDEALKAIGYRGSEPTGSRKIGAFLELHIEQGPFLERSSCEIGVVEGAQGMVWYDAEIVGEENHAGTTPMELRRDALTCFSEMCLRIETIARGCSGTVGTVGFVSSQPGSRNTVPGRVLFSIEFRHPESNTLDLIHTMIMEAATEIGSRRNVQIKIEAILRKPPAKFDRRCISVVESVARRLGYSYSRMSSGATHDACNVSLVAPTAMIFVPCEHGVSHRETEYTTPEHCASGANVLLHSVVTLANGPENWLEA